jgi:hypothetical protein
VPGFFLDLFLPVSVLYVFVASFSDLLRVEVYFWRRVYDNLGVALVLQTAILLGQFICLYGCFGILHSGLL